jgi:hypothetical protein
MNIKKIILVVVSIFIIIPTLSFGQDATMINKKNVSYSFITEHGLYLGWDIGYTGVFVNGICFNKTQDLIGIGVGVEYGIASGLSIPIYANYRHYFPSKTKLEPLVNVAIGTRFCAVYSWKPSMMGLYTTIASGFRVKSFSFTSGLFVKSLNNDFFAGFEIKLGYAFNANKK